MKFSEIKVDTLFQFKIGGNLFIAQKKEMFVRDPDFPIFFNAVVEMGPNHIDTFIEPDQEVTV